MEVNRDKIYELVEIVFSFHAIIPHAFIERGSTLRISKVSLMLSIELILHSNIVHCVIWIE